jgi:hypothetical protein
MTQITPDKKILPCIPTLRQPGKLALMFACAGAHSTAALSPHPGLRTAFLSQVPELGLTER